MDILRDSYDKSWRRSNPIYNTYESRHFGYIFLYSGLMSFIWSIMFMRKKKPIIVCVPFALFL